MTNKNETAGSELAELSPEQRALEALSYDATKAKLEVLATQSRSIVRVDDDDNLAAAKAARAVLVGARTKIAKTGKAARDGALKFQKAVIAKERELIDVIQPEESRLDGLVSAEDLRRAEAERAVKEAEERRAEIIRTAFARIRSLPGIAETANIPLIDKLLDEAAAFLADPGEIPDDMRAAAKYEANVATNALRAVRDRREAADRDALELEELRKEKAARDAADAKAAREKAVADAKEQVAREEAARAAQLAEAKGQTATQVAADVPEVEQTAAVTHQAAPAGFVGDDAPINSRAAAVAAPVAARHAVDLLSAARAAMGFLVELGHSGHPVVQDLADAIDDADLPGGF